VTSTNISGGERLAASREPSHHQSSHLRNRYLRRAKSLLRDDAFAARVAELRAEWDDRFPALAIKIPEGPPSDIPIMFDKRYGFLIVPERLARVWQRIISERDSTGLSQTFGNMGAEALVPLNGWRTLVISECRHWWPPSQFANYAGQYGHPASAFLGACLAYDLSSFPPDRIDRLIAKHHEVLFWHPFDPTDDDAHPTIAGLRAEQEYLWSVVGSSIGDDHERLREIQDTAARRRIAAERRSQGNSADWWYIPLTPAVPADWELAGKLITNQIDHVYGPNPVHDHVELLAANGEKPRAIARTLGLSESRVRQVLQESR
jgi:hypothetical protein